MDIITVKNKYRI